MIEATAEFRSRFPYDVFDNDVFVRGGSAKNNGKAGWADIVQWSDDTVYVWEVKHAGGPAEAEGAAQLDRYLVKLREMLAAQGDPRRVAPGSRLGKTLGPVPNIWNPTEDITVQDGGEPGIITYTWEKNDGKRVPRTDPTPVPVANPRPLPEGTPEKRPKWVSTRPLRPMPVPDAAQASAPPGGSLMPHASPGTVATLGGFGGALWLLLRVTVGVGEGAAQGAAG